MILNEINNRYTELATKECCLSCGGAINYCEAKPDEVCVDLGSGKGLDVFRLAEAVGEKGFVYGIDISDGMLKIANINASKLGINNVKFVKSPLEKIELESNIADLVISNCTLNHSLEKVKVFSEINRILKPNGRIVISDIYSIGEVPEEFKNDPIAVAECWAGAVTREIYFKILIDTGFKVTDIYEESKPYDKGKIQVASFTFKAVKP